MVMWLILIGWQLDPLKFNSTMGVYLKVIGSVMTHFPQNIIVLVYRYTSVYVSLVELFINHRKLLWSKTLQRKAHTDFPSSVQYSSVH